MLHIRLQMGCLLVVLYITIDYIRELRAVKKQHRLVTFDALLLATMIGIFFDGLSAYTVNHLDTVAPLLNIVAHLFFLISVDTIIYLMFLYMLHMTDRFPKKRGDIILISLPYFVNILLVMMNIFSLEYRIGTYTNYSMGISAITCFIMVAIYIVMTFLSFCGRWNYIGRQNRESIFLYFLILVLITGYQMYNPEALLSSVGFTILVVGIYVNQENPSIRALSHYHDEMVTGFATLVEKGDSCTGEHIRRTSMYVELLAEELRNRGLYKKILTKDYIKNLTKAAPLHDIGKLSIPDTILQKKDTLTEEDFELVKKHSELGGNIIKETFGKIENQTYINTAYDMTLYHHEKWDGSGYPIGLKGDAIPLSARIMAISDVFDACSEKRSYRDAMSLEECFKIIKEGRGKDFDPELVDAFLDIDYKIIRAYNSVEESK